MESTYLVAGVALALFASMFAWYEIKASKKEVQRHKDAAVNFRLHVNRQKDALVDALVERLDLRDKQLPPIDMATFTKIDELYQNPELSGLPLPVTARDRYDFYWTRYDLQNRELFVLWLEGIIEL